MTVRFDDIAVGDTFGDATTVTEAHIVAAAGLFNDHAPLHTDEVFARSTRFGTRIAHGPLIIGMMAGALSRYFGTNALGLLEESATFRAPVVAGDTITTRWTVRATTVKEKLGGGIVELVGVCTNEGDAIVVEETAKLIVGN